MEKPIYILAQLDTKTSSKGSKTVVGRGSDVLDTEVAQKKAKKKLITRTTALKLAIHAKSEGDKIAQKSYWNTYYCMHKVTTSNGYAFGDYCRNRICAICSGIRTAELIRKYQPIVEEWDDPHFVTCTAQTCRKHKLKARVSNTIRAYQIVKKRMYMRYKRGKGVKPVGIWSLECNYNPVERWYNPHFHFIFPDEETAKVFVSEWLKLWTSKYASYKAQDIRPLRTNTVEDMFGTIKYGTKVFTDPNMKKGKSRVKTNDTIYIAALHNILNAFKGHQIFGSFGFKLPEGSERKPVGAKVLQHWETWEFDHSGVDWMNDVNGEPLTDYSAPHLLLNMLENNIDTESE